MCFIVHFSSSPINWA
uniref:Uncharacterized protein n=1 Tax=Arundo donax TaxID=35708 RepID=A0A0A8YSN7_ARUDO